MNLWLWFAALLLLATAPAGIGCLRGDTMERFVALQLAQVVSAMVLLLLAEGFHRAIYFDVALAMAILALASGLVFARFLERWL